MQCIDFTVYSFACFISLRCTQRKAGIRKRSAMHQATGSPKQTPVHASAGTSQRLTPQRAIISITPLSMERLLKPRPWME